MRYVFKREKIQALHDIVDNLQGGEQHALSTYLKIVLSQKGDVLEMVLTDRQVAYLQRFIEAWMEATDEKA